MTRPPPPWPAAAARLAGRVAARERRGALLRSVGTLLLAAAASGLLGRAAGLSAAAVAAFLGAAVAAGLALGARRALRVPPVSPADAAWALDRRAGARGRGLVAAVVPGAVGAEAAWTEPAVRPPAVHLRPAPGLALAATAALLAAIALLVPGRAPAPTPRGPGAPDAPSPSAAGGGDGARAADAAAEAALAAERVREALGLSRESAADPALVAERLQDPGARRAAEGAAAGTGLEGAVGTSPSDAEDLARALVGGARSEEEARRLRRQGASERAARAEGSVPLARRAVVERWFARAAPEGGSR